MDSILVSVDEPQNPELVSFPVVCLYLFPRRPDLSEEAHRALWQQLRDLVHNRCGGEVAMLGCDGTLLFYPNNHTPLLASLLTEPAFFDLLEEHAFDGRAVKLFFHHSYCWNGLPWRPNTLLLEMEEVCLSAFNRALQQMGRYAGTPHPIPETAPGQRLLCTTVPPIGWFVKAPASQPAHPTGSSTRKSKTH